MQRQPLWEKLSVTSVIKAGQYAFLVPGAFVKINQVTDDLTKSCRSLSIGAQHLDTNVEGSLRPWSLLVPGSVPLEEAALALMERDSLVIDRRNRR